MEMRKLLLLAESFFLFIMLIGCAAKKADLIFKNANIITMDEKNPRAQAIAIRGDKILAVGSNQQIERFRGKGTEVLDLEGKTVVPGLIDAHMHLISLGKSLSILNFVGTSSLDEILKMVKGRVEKVKPGEWILGRGWDQNDWPIKEFPTRWDLDKVAPQNPVYLTRICGHMVWVNSKVLEMAGITKETKAPEGGKVIYDPSTGEPTGVFVDQAIDLVERVLPPPTYQQKKEYAKRAIQECLRVGLTEVHDASVDLEMVKIYKELLREGNLPLRLYLMLRGPGREVEAYLEKGPEIGLGDHRLTIRAIKLFADGSLGSRGAALLEPYSDDPGNRGLITINPDTAYGIMVRALERGFQVCTHAIGDSANRMVLNLIEKALKEHPKKDHRFRIEHAQVIAPEDIPRFAQLGVIPSMQPIHCTSDMYWAEERLGPERVKGAYAWRSLLDTGVRIPGGSDAPVESVNPLWGIYAAVTRQDHKGWPEGGWHPEQKVSREEALRMFTLDAAYGAFEEKIKGSLEKGKLADLTVLSKDIMTVPAPEILQTEVLMTVVGGRIVFEKGK